MPLFVVVLFVVLSLLSLWKGVSWIRHPTENFQGMEKAAEPRTLAWWDAYLAGWALVLLAIVFAGLGLMLLLALLHILPTGPPS